MNKHALALAAALLLANASGAAEKVSMQYTPVSCIKAGELPLLQLNIEGKGELRSYFRRINNTDWCSVEGLNDGPLSRVVLPKFDNGDEIEYFFVLLQGRRVVARSPRIYRARITDDCQMPFARHVLKLSMSCGEDAQAIPSALGAGYAISFTEPCVVSPDSPDDIPCGPASQVQGQQ